MNMNMNAPQAQDDVNRPRNAVRGRENLEFTDHPELYHDDGNVILKCRASTTIFRVHKSILSKHSPVFKDILDRAASAPFPVKFRDCWLVEVDDDFDDMAALLRTIYDAFNIAVPSELSVEEFPSFAGLLRVTTKYRVERVRSILLDRLHQEWPSSYDQHLAKVASFSAQYHARDANAEDIIVHPASVIALLRDCNYTPSSLLAPLFYDLSTRTWQFGEDPASTGYHLAPLNTSEMERFVVGITKLRSLHAKLAEPPRHLPIPMCRTHFVMQWVERALPVLQRDANFMCTPVEDWTALLAQVKEARWPMMCDTCEQKLIGYCEESGKKLWETVLAVFS
ncbi:hypothetical protein ONZ45_g1183 [Pleurotus djamor]|nr:hypothetical protein ONZ45_g1183 [Pleurotus djamor]